MTHLLQPRAIGVVAIIFASGLVLVVLVVVVVVVVVAEVSCIPDALLENYHPPSATISSSGLILGHFSAVGDIARHQRSTMKVVGESAKQATEQLARSDVLLSTG